MPRPAPHRRPWLALLFGLAVLGPATSPAQTPEADWPTQPLRLVVGYPAGTSPDLVARAVQEPLAQALGKPVVIENKPGAGGNLGVAQVVAASDSHTIGFTTNGPLTTARQLYTRPGFDVAKDVVPLVLAATSPLVLVLNTQAPPTNLAEFIRWAKSQPGGISFGSIGQGSGSHLTMELFAHRAGLQMVHVPFQGFPQVTQSIVGQQVNAAFMAPSGALAQARGGKVKLLGTSAPERSPLAPDLAPIAEALPGFQAELWVAAFGTPHLPARAAQRLSRELSAILQRPEVKAQLLQQGWNAVGGGPEVLSKRIQDDTALWTSVIRQAGVKPE